MLGGPPLTFPFAAGHATALPPPWGHGPPLQPPLGPWGCLGLSGCPSGWGRMVGIAGPLTLSSSPFLASGRGGGCGGAITLLCSCLICQRAQRGEDPVSAGCPRDKRHRGPSQDIFSTAPPPPSLSRSPLPPSPRFSWQRTKRENERTPFKALLLSILSGAWIPFWMPDCWHSRSPRSLNCNSWGLGVTAGGCQHVPRTGATQGGPKHEEMGCPKLTRLCCPEMLAGIWESHPAPSGDAEHPRTPQGTACCSRPGRVFHFNIFQRFSFDFTLFCLILFEDDNDLPFPNEKSFGTHGGKKKIYFFI